MAAALTVLVADDHEIHRTLLTNIFRSFGCSVSAVSDGAEALGMRAAFDLVCLDRHMPGLSGPQVAAALEGSAFVVACTSDPSGDLSGFHHVMTKPISCSEVAYVVAAAHRWRAYHGAYAWEPRHALRLAGRVARMIGRWAC